MRLSSTLIQSIFNKCTSNTGNLIEAEEVSLLPTNLLYLT